MRVVDNRWNHLLVGEPVLLWLAATSIAGLVFEQLAEDEAGAVRKLQVRARPARAGAKSRATSGRWNCCNRR